MALAELVLGSCLPVDRRSGIHCFDYVIQTLIVNCDEHRRSWTGSVEFILYISLLISLQAVPAAQRGSWTSFLKSYAFFTKYIIHLLTSLFSIASFSGDLSSLTAPPFILSPTSLTEFPGKPPHVLLR